MEHGELEPVGVGDIKCSEKACRWKEETQFLGRQEQACQPASVCDGVCPLWGGYCGSAGGSAVAFLQMCPSGPKPLPGVTVVAEKSQR